MNNIKISNKGKNYTKRRIFTIFALVLTVGFFLYQLQNTIFAEQSDSSPESGVTSRIKTIYDSLVSLSHGSESVGGWGDWGALWNRIRSAAEWVPTGNATETDVVSGKTFYKDSRTQKTGTLVVPETIDYSQQSLVDFDDYQGYDLSNSQDFIGEESVWQNTAVNVKKDTRTGLYWADPLVSYPTNQFTKASCDFFTTTPRGSYAGGDSDCGSAINACATLSREATTGQGVKTDWYLPSYKEQMQAYIDGIYNQNSLGGGTPLYQGDQYWSSTEASYLASLAWTTDIYNGLVPRSKASTRGVQCVRRD